LARAICDPSGTAYPISTETVTPLFFHAIKVIADQRAEFCTDFRLTQGEEDLLHPAN